MQDLLRLALAVWQQAAVLAVVASACLAAQQAAAADALGARVSAAAEAAPLSAVAAAAVVAPTPRHLLTPAPATAVACQKLLNSALQEAWVV
jgi:hypothetical protein